MSNHIHLIIQSEEGKLSDLIRDFKKFTAKSILEKIQNSPESRRDWILERFILAAQNHSRNKNYQFWQYGNHAEEIYSNNFMWSKLDYVHLNQVRSGLVARASDYIYSSANNYVNNEGLLSIEKADNPDRADMTSILDIDSNPIARICLYVRYPRSLGYMTRSRGYVSTYDPIARNCIPCP